METASYTCRNCGGSVGSASCVEAALDRFIARYAPNGRIEKIGPTDECLKFEEFDDYADGRLSRRRRERYEAHFAACADCEEVRQRLEEYLSGQRSSGAIAVWWRTATVLPYRMKDYMDERSAER